jgi:hypothetical protein
MSDIDPGEVLPPHVRAALRDGVEDFVADTVMPLLRERGIDIDEAEVHRLVIERFNEEVPKLRQQIIGLN